MKVVYIAGPFRGASRYDEVKHIRKAEELSWKVWETGKAVAVCPHLNTANFQGSLPDDIWLKGDLELMLRCDAVLTTDDWEQSSGAKEEVKVALEDSMPVFHTLEAFCATL